MAELIPLGDTVVADMFNGDLIRYPIDPDKTTIRYDFHFTKKGVWFYVNSMPDPKHALVRKQCDVVERKGEQWRIIDTTNNTICQNSLTPRSDRSRSSRIKSKSKS